ncbi:hypothetical protein L210DRAFT_849732 [Boletus edulis BED1]|uniref:CDP-diacylglycerol--glycerol-3-phosphate 3-phosphatidyltransferase n=1 Tax=Boletus edulis BED1 TaxID=1328754 RepID=A0AAD4GJI4_BOLED|nr:hypothetical protein L210DRAFT_849732 [Boletus edulis BED1]
MSLLSLLAATQPAIPLPASAIRVLNSPSSFHSTLIDIVRRAKRRVFLSSLYLGASEHDLVPSLDTALRQNDRLHLHLTLDYNRSTRPGPDSPVLALLPLLRAHGPRVHVSLFRSPNLSGPMTTIVPPRFNEGWGTWHPKIYGADDDVIITGANLNKSYFTNRQDRYIHFNAQPNLADYCFSFLQLISSFSYNIFSSSATDAPIIQWPDPSIQPWKIQSKVHNALSKFQASRLTHSHHTDNTVLFPIIQGGQFNIREEERTLSTIFNYLASQHSSHEPTPVMTWTSGYFGLYSPYQDMILKSPAACEVIAAGPKANGFYGSRGLSGLIPEGYTLLEQRFMRAVRAAGRLSDQRDDAVTLLEWEKPGWTYHAKGSIWLSPSKDSLPVLTMFGSTNLNSRSANLDTELSFVMVTSSKALQQSLHDEVCNLRRWAGPWRGADRKVRLRTKAIVGLVGGML